VTAAVAAVVVAAVIALSLLEVGRAHRGSASVAGIPVGLRRLTWALVAAAFAGIAVQLALTIG
jgi:hypothetical protein